MWIIHGPAVWEVDKLPTELPHPVLDTVVANLDVIQPMLLSV